MIKPQPRHPPFMGVQSKALINVMIVRSESVNQRILTPSENRAGSIFRMISIAEPEGIAVNLIHPPFQPHAGIWRMVLCAPRQHRRQCDETGYHHSLQHARLPRVISPPIYRHSCLIANIRPTLHVRREDTALTQQLMAKNNFIFLQCSRWISKLNRLRL